MHSLVYVVLPSTQVLSCEKVYDEVYRLLGGSEWRPEQRFGFDQLLCACVSWKARNDSFKQFDASPEGVVLFKVMLDARAAGQRETEERLLAERLAKVAALERAHLLRDQPEPTCETCRGTGVDRVSHDPHGKFDAWSLGGRWKGRFEGLPTSDGADGELRGNVAFAREIPGDRLSSAIVTPDGDWRSGPITLGDRSFRGGAERRESDRWDVVAQELLLRYADRLVVVVDCHS